MPTLSAVQYGLVFNMFSFTIAAMLGAFVFFVLTRSRVAPAYRMSLILSALVVGIAGYHYWRITGSWQGAYELAESGEYVATGKPFNDAYRYVDWLLTVPLLVVELILVMRLSKGGGKLAAQLAAAALLMVALGYPGEIAETIGGRLLWGTLSTIPFIYIVWTLWAKLGDAIAAQPPKAQVLLRNIRLLLLATWGFYPIVYMLPYIESLTGAAAMTGVQVGYTIADVLAKAGYGVMIYAIARAKSDADGWTEAA
jgi:bacteriorhodopsin